MYLNYLSCVKTQYRPTFPGRKLMGVTAARVKTEKSKRRPGKSAHVAIDVKPAGAAMHAATITSKEVASCYSRPNSVSSTPAVQFAPLPSRLSRPRRPDAGTRRGRGADSTVKYWVNLNQRDRAVGRCRYVWVQCRPVFVRLCVCETKMKWKIALREEKMSVNR